jgi:RecA/RadA recombinase
MTKLHSPSTIARPNNEHPDPALLSQRFFDTGFPALNSLVSGADASTGGIPRGALVEMAGPAGIGKSALLLRICRSLSEAGEAAVYLDVDHAVTEFMLRGAGLPTASSSLFRCLQPTTIEELDTTLTLLLRSEPPPALIVIDSITAALPARSLEANVEETSSGLQYKLLTALLQKFKPKLKKRGVTLVLVSQMRRDCHHRFSKSTRPAGGPALAHYCDVRLILDLPYEMGNRLDSKLDSKVPVGDVIVRPLKNRFAETGKPRRLSLGF